jgi:phosphotransferase system enzyme I (PtsI)
VSQRSSEREPAIVLDGIAGSPGLATGKAVVLDLRAQGVPRRHLPKSSADDEMERFDRAVRSASAGLREMADRVAASAARAESSILNAYILMVEDDVLRADVERRIRLDRMNAEWALDTAVNEMAGQLRDGGDPYLAERSHDFEFVGDYIQRAFAGKPGASSVPRLDAPSVIVARDLSPAETAGLVKDRVLAMVTEVGTRTSHTSILARALEIPAVVGVAGVLERVANGDTLLVDGHRGHVTINPTRAMLRTAAARSERLKAVARGLRESRDRPAATRCGVPIQIRANIELPAEAAIALDHGARGIGLYRTEFVYVDRQDLPSEDEQYEIYRSVVEQCAPLPVTLRTFDIGGDKFASAFQVPSEMNPALGLRAVRLGLARPELFLEQLRAMVRASAHGTARIMVPMISGLLELRAVRALLDRAIEEVDASGRRRAAEIPLGIMVEVPAAALLADLLAREAAFFSIGTNDLVQYTLAVDRTSREVASIASPYHPAILRLIRLVLDAGEQAGCPVFVCGAMATDPVAAALLIGMGVRELSMEASAIPEVKEAIGRVTLEQARRAAARALAASTSEESEQSVRDVLGPAFAELLRAED